MNPSSSACNPTDITPTPEDIAELEDERNKYEDADQGFEMGFIPLARHNASAHSSVGPEEEPQKPTGRVIPTITPSDEMRLYGEMYAEYGHPHLVRMKMLFAFGVAMFGCYCMRVALLTGNPVMFCAAAGVVAVVSAAYMLTRTGA